jgi:CheY-like chemotaxis protein
MDSPRRPVQKRDWAKLEGRRILIVEDDSLQAIHLAQMITGLGAAVAGIATSVQGALAELSTKDFDCVLLDLNLNESFSLGMAKGLRDMGIPFAFCTAYGHVIKDFSQAPIVQKPVSERALALALIDAIERRMRP